MKLRPPLRPALALLSLSRGLALTAQEPIVRTQPEHAVVGTNGTWPDESLRNRPYLDDGTGFVTDVVVE